MACEDECISQYQCYPPNEPLDGAIFSPWVKLTVRGGEEYTVGNESSESDLHKTCIKSFQYGTSVASGGVGAKFELVSEGGESYIKFAQAINKTVNRANEDTDLTFFEFGWIIKTCDGNTRKISSERIHCMIKTMQSTHDGGIIKISIECIDMMIRHFERRIDGNFGSDDNKIPLKQAIRELYGNNDPIMEIEFPAADGGELQFKYGDAEGPRAKWPGDQQNALSVSRKWLTGNITKNDKGTIVQYDPFESKLHIAEDPQPGPGENVDCCQNSIGTYVVNAGNCSDVISFTPTIDWVLWNNNAGGTPGGGDSGNMQETSEPDSELMENTGPQSNPTIPTYMRDQISPNATARAMQESTAAQSRANKGYEVKSGFEAELKILGDPEFVNPVLLKGSSVSIIVINPYYLDTGCTWISTPKCNEILSNKNYLVLGVDHQIEAGKYTTTIKVKLTLPNVDQDQGTPPGGDGCGTTFFDNDSGQPIESD